MNDRCPSCGTKRPYLMSRNADSSVLPPTLIWWIVAIMFALLLLTH